MEIGELSLCRLFYSRHHVPTINHALMSTYKKANLTNSLIGKKGTIKIVCEKVQPTEPK